MARNPWLKINPIINIASNSQAGNDLVNFIGVPIAAAIISIIQTYGKRYELIPELHSIETKS